MLNSKYYMCSDNILLVENEQPFSPISQLNYEFYDAIEPVWESLKNNESIQAIVGHFGIPFGQAQSPSLTDYADGIDTMKWLSLMVNRESWMGFWNFHLFTVSFTKELKHLQSWSHSQFTILAPTDIFSVYIAVALVLMLLIGG